MHIRDFRRSDFPQIIKLWKETGIADPDRGDTMESIEACIDHGGRFLVMEDQARQVLIGSSWMTFDGRRMYLHHFCIKPSYQNKGYGTELTRASLHFLKEQGHQVKLEVHKDNHFAIRLYRKFGFFKFNDYDILMIRDLEALNV